jgi:hypothetical protein
MISFRPKICVAVEWTGMVAHAYHYDIHGKIAEEAGSSAFCRQQWKNCYLAACAEVSGERHDADAPNASATASPDRNPSS